jgi:hypothetical protein
MDEESRYNYALTKKLLEQQQNEDDQKKDKDKAGAPWLLSRLSLNLIPRFI